MNMLLDEDYEYLESIGFLHEENESQRFLVFLNFPLPDNMYQSVNGEVLSQCEVLFVVPEDYNTSGGDMFWTYPALQRVDGLPIPAVGGGDHRDHSSKHFERWSRHWGGAGWSAKRDNVVKIIDRITWAFETPNANT